MARRVLALVRKEFQQVRRDPSGILIAGVLPVLLLFLFGYGVSLDLRQIPLAIVLEAPTPAGQSLVQAFANTHAFAVTTGRDRSTAQAALVRQEVRGVLVIPADFDARRARGDPAPVQIIVDGSEPNSAGLVQGYVQGVWAVWQAQERLVGRGEAAPAITVDTRTWYNPTLESRNFLIPGSIAITLSLIGTLLTALVVAREWERGTMEALLTTPVRLIEILAGKLIPYYLLGLGSMTVSVLVATGVFQVPFRGSVLALVLLSSVFLVSALGQGLLISTLARNQFVASQAALMSAFLPAFQLSGFVFEISSMPAPIRAVTYIFPARYYVNSLQTLFLVGDVWPALVGNMVAMAGIGAVLFGMTARVSRRRLE